LAGSARGPRGSRDAAALARRSRVLRRRTHWDYVLAEMGWMAADMAGERLWKLHAAASFATAAARAHGQPTRRALDRERAARVAASLVANCVAGEPRSALLARACSRLAQPSGRAPRRCW